jgi:ribokinase
VAYNPSFKHLQGEGREDLLRHLQDVSFLVLNEGEAAELTGISFEKEQEVFADLDARVPGIVAVTGGKKGVRVSDGAHIYKAGVFKEERVEDRTGAGDAFGSGFVAGLLQTQEECKKGACNPDNIAHAIRLASANATSVIEQVGATPGTLTKEAFETDPRWKKLDITIM